MQRRLQDVFKTYPEVKMLLLTSLQDIFNTFLYNEILFPVHKVSQENMCGIVFEKVQGCAGKVNRKNLYAEAALRWVL